MSAASPIPVQEMLLHQITLDRTLQARESMDLELVKEYANLYQMGARFPPLEGVRVGEVVYLTEGWHRFNALERIHRQTCDIIVTKGTLADAKFAAALSNSTHGMRRKYGDAPRVLKIALEGIALLADQEWDAWINEHAMGRHRRHRNTEPGWNHGDLARMTGYDASTVSKYFYTVFATLNVEQAATIKRREAGVTRDEFDRWLMMRPGESSNERDVQLDEPPRNLPILLRVADEQTGQRVGVIRDGNIAEQAHAVTTSLIDKALQEQQTRGMRLTEAEHQARVRVHALLQVESVLHSLYAVPPEEMAEAWAIDRPQEDLALLLDGLVTRFTDYANAVKAAERPALRAVK